MKNEKEQLPPCAVTGGPEHGTGDDSGRSTGHRFCQHHFEQLDKTLREIEKEARHLVFDPGDPDDWSPLPSIAIRLNTGGGGNSGGGTLASEQTPVRLEPVVLSDVREGWGRYEEPSDTMAAGRSRPTLNILRGWADKVRADPARLLAPQVVTWPERRPGVVRGLRPACQSACWHESCTAIRRDWCPAPCEHELCNRLVFWRTRPAAATVTTERTLLSRQLPWIAEQSWAGAFYIAMRTALTQLRQANLTAERRPIPGRCPAQTGNKECGGPLWPAKPKHTVGEWKGSTPEAIRCGACNTRWEGAGALARLALILEEQERSKT